MNNNILKNVSHSKLFKTIKKLLDLFCHEKCWFRLVGFLSLTWLSSTVSAFLI